MLSLNRMIQRLGSWKESHRCCTDITKDTLYLVGESLPSLQRDMLSWLISSR